VAKSKKRNIFQKFIPVSALAATLCLSSAGVSAAGLGKITVLSPLGQPLRAELDITASREELASMAAKLASAEAFRQAGIEYVPSMAGIRFSIDKRNDGRPFLRVSTDRPVNDPFLDILVELTWSSGRLVREYTMLLDPPEALSMSSRPAVVAPEAQRAPVAAPPAPAESGSVMAEPGVSKRPPSAPAPTKVEKSAADTSSQAGSRVVKTGDTLAKIAAATKPEGVSLDQMLVALFRNNESAFSGGNMNRLRAGRILSLPDAETVAATAPADARKVVVAQANDFNSYRKRLAESVAAAPAIKEEAAKQAAEGKIAPRVEEKAAAPALGKDKLEVSRTEAAKDAKAVQGRITALEEDLVARDRALKEASGRVAELEKNLADLKKLAELKSQSGAQLQQQAQTTQTAKAVAEAKPTVPESAPAPAVAPQPAEAVVVKPEEAKPSEKPAETPPVEQAAKPAAPVVEKPKTVVVPKSPVEEPSFIDENSTLVYGGGGVIALLLGYFGFSAWRRKHQGGDETSPPSTGSLTGSELMANSVFGSTGGQSVDTGASIQTDFSQANLTAIDTDEGVDPVAEADVYMAYGRDAQAEEILVDALKNDPSRHAIHLKLLEIYAGRKSVKQFEGVASDLHGQTGGAGPDWQKAAAMGLALDPGNALYAGGVAATPDEEPKLAALAATTVIIPPSELDKLRDTMTLPGHFAQIASAADEAGAPPPPLDFDLDQTLPGGISSAPASEAAPESIELDFNLDLDAPSVAESDQRAGSAVASGELDIDLSMPEPDIGSQAAPSNPVTLAGEQAPSNIADGLDFEFDLDSTVVQGEPTVVASPSSLDLSAIDLDLDVAPGATAVSDARAVSPQVETEIMGVAEAAGGDGGEDNPDVATKFELAQAYEEMGDKEGARELLQEVLNEGSGRQQELARAKLATLDV
jgi:pilus assembly protein FimV